MNRLRTVSLIAATLGVAVGAGTLFQQEMTRQEAASVAQAQADLSIVRLASAETAVTDALSEPESDTSLQTATPVSEMPVATASLLPGAASTIDPLSQFAHPATVPATGMELAQRQDAPAPAQPGIVTLATDPAVIDDLLAEVDACAVWLVVTPEDGAMLDMSLFAPCDGGERVEISHAGLRFDARIGEDGQLAISFPALMTQAEVRVTFDDGRASSDATPVPDAPLFDRVAIYWQGPAVMGLSVYEPGSDFDGDGLVLPASAASGDPARGFLTALGDTVHAQVYSFPQGLPAAASDFELALEVAVTDESCGQALTAATIAVPAGAEAVRNEIRLEMPECDGQGGFLVLKNLLPELTIALN